MRSALSYILFGVDGYCRVALRSQSDTVFCELELQINDAIVVTPPDARKEPTPTTCTDRHLRTTTAGCGTSPRLSWWHILRRRTPIPTSVMAPTEELQAKLYAEMLSHIKETDESVPYRDRGWFYYVRTVEGSQYPIHCRRLATGPTVPETHSRKRFCWT